MPACSRCKRATTPLIDAEIGSYQVTYYGRTAQALERAGARWRGGEALARQLGIRNEELLLTTLPLVA